MNCDKCNEPIKLQEMKERNYISRDKKARSYVQVVFVCACSRWSGGLHRWPMQKRLL